MSGAIFCEYLCIVRFIKMFLKQSFWNVIFQIICPVVMMGLYYFTNLFFNMGVFRIYTIFGFVLGFFLYNITFYKILDKLHKTIYNKLTKLSSIKYTKLGKFILK